MIQTGPQTAKWPEKIHYVCSSTFGNVVNATPIIHAGARKIVGMRILFGVRKTGSPTRIERRQSIDPAKRLEKFANDHQITKICRVNGNPEDFGAWNGALSKAIKCATRDGVAVVYNVTGGTKEMVLGALLGLSPKERSQIMIISVSKTERACVSLTFDGTGGLRQQFLPPNRKIKIAELLQLYGYAETSTEKREKHEEFLRRHRHVGKSVIDAVRKVDRNILGALYKAMSVDKVSRITLDELMQQHLSKRARKRLRDKSDHQFASLIGSFEGLEGMCVNADSRGRITSVYVDQRARRFMAGIWLESVVFGMVEDIFEQHKQEVELAAGLRLAVSTASDTKHAETDIALFVDAQLHMIEVKAVTSTVNFKEYSPKLVSLRDELGSHQMRTFLVTTLLSEHQVKLSKFRDRISKQGVELFAGLARNTRNKGKQDALEQLQNELKQIRK